MSAQPSPIPMPSSNEFISWFETLGNADVARVGGKNASLGEMVQRLAPQGVRVPEGFATTAAAYRAYVEANDIRGALAGRLAELKRGDATLHETGEAARRLFLDGELPPAIAQAIRDAYKELSRRGGAAEASVAVRSSATAEDLPDASFAGQQETFLNVRGERELLEACRRCYASLFTDRAISYRETKGFEHLEVALSIGVQRMVRSDLAGSGVMFSIDTESGFPRAAVINAAWGLGETVVQGAVDPDKYVVFKPLLADARLRPIIEKTLGGKERKMIYATGGSARTLTLETTQKERQSFVLTDEEILQLGRWATTVEAHYGRAMDMEWAKDGQSGELYLVQARPETVQSSRRAGTLKSYYERYRAGFALECRALAKVRAEMGFANVIVMVPFCRTPEEADRVLAVMAEHGLKRGEKGLEVYMMCEVPSNVILAEQFAQRFDGFSIGSNDLTQLVLGVDRDSGDLARLFDERSEAITRFISEAIAKAHAAGIKIGICGQAPSNYPEFADFLVEQGIDSISLNPDSFATAARHVALTEERLAASAPASDSRVRTG